MKIRLGHYNEYPNLQRKTIKIQPGESGEHCCLVTRSPVCFKLESLKKIKNKSSSPLTKKKKKKKGDVNNKCFTDTKNALLIFINKRGAFCPIHNIS